VLSYITCDTTGENITASKLSKYTLHTYSGALLIDESYDRCEFNQIQPLPKSRGSSSTYYDSNTGQDELDIIINNSSRSSTVIYPNEEITVSLMNENKTEVNHYIKNLDRKVCYKRYWQMLDAYEPGGLPFKPLKQQKKSLNKEKNIQAICTIYVKRKTRILNHFIETRSTQRIKTKSLAKLFEKIQHGFNGTNQDLIQKISEHSNAKYSPVVYPQEEQDFINNNFVSKLEYQNSTNEGTWQVPLIKTNEKVSNLTQPRRQLENWRENVEDLLITQERRKLFDLQLQCEKLINKLSEISSSNCSDKMMNKSTKADRAIIINQDVPFLKLFKGRPAWEQARDFVALLHLVNNGSMSIRTSDDRNHAIQIHR